MNQINYPSVLDRVKGILIDAIVIIVLMFLITYAFSLFSDAPDFARVIAFAFVFILYDPIFTSSFGGTIGHMTLGIRVRKESNVYENISLPLALLRYFVKALLGFISFLTVSSNEKKKAIHDMVVGSVVIYVKPK